MTDNRYKILFIISIILLVLILTFVIVSVCVYLHYKRSNHDNSFDLAELATTCSNAQSDMCVCSKANPKNKLCIAEDGKSFTILNKQYVLPETLPKSETDPYTVSFLGNKIGVFQNPFYPSNNVVCFKNQSLQKPRRLCFDLVKKEAFIFGPTDFSQSLVKF